MSIAKHLSYARSQSQTERPRQIDGPSFAHLYIHHDEIGCAALLASTSPRSAIAAASVKSRSIFRTAAQLVESSGDILLTVASWMLKQILDGCFAYAVAMYGMPAATIHAEVSEPESSAPPELPVNSSRPTLHLISPDIGAGENVFSAGCRTTLCQCQMRGSIRADAWCACGLAHCDHRANGSAAVENPRGERQAPGSRRDIGYIARYGARHQ